LQLREAFDGSFEGAVLLQLAIGVEQCAKGRGGQAACERLHAKREACTARAAVGGERARHAVLGRRLLLCRQLRRCTRRPVEHDACEAAGAHAVGRHAGAHDTSESRGHALRHLEAHAAGQASARRRRGRLGGGGEWRRRSLGLHVIELGRGHREQLRRPPRIFGSLPLCRLPRLSCWRRRRFGLLSPHPIVLCLAPLPSSRSFGSKARGRRRRSGGGARPSLLHGRATGELAPWTGWRETPAGSLRSSLLLLRLRTSDRFLPFCLHTSGRLPPCQFTFCLTLCSTLDPKPFRALPLSFGHGLEGQALATIAACLAACSATAARAASSFCRLRVASPSFLARSASQRWRWSARMSSIGTMRASAMSPLPPVRGRPPPGCLPPGCLYPSRDIILRC
jgi:hypothetical protein